jgi:hypothetical protein
MKDDLGNASPVTIRIILPNSVKGASRLRGRGKKTPVSVSEKKTRDCGRT